MAPDRESDFHAELGDDRAALQGHGLGIALIRLGDRWTSAIELPDRPGSEITLARAVESQPERDDPERVVSPVYQELHLHGPDRGPSLCLLLTGKSSEHHFSAAVSLARDPAQPESILLDMDVADRCRAGLLSFAATYLVDLDANALQAADPHRIAWEIPGPNAGRLELLALHNAALALAEGGRRATRVQVLASIQPGTFTHRLRYGWRWTNSDELTR